MLRELGFSDERAAEIAALGGDPLTPGRVVRSGRRKFQVITAHGEVAAALPGRAYAHGERVAPVVGDWLALLQKGDRWMIAHVLARTSAFRRRAAGRATASQVIVANVDTALLMMGLDEDFNPRRLERYLALAHGSGAAPVVVLNKRDVAGDLDAKMAEVHSLASGLPVLAISAKHDGDVAAVEPHLRPGTTIALLGSSGVGKSTLVNRLLGEERQRIAEVRASDGKGRHTTTARELIRLPSGALLIDTPGMRELGMWDDADEGLAATFAEIGELAANCRFADCEHTSEPGCAVREALESGALDKSRWASFRKLQGEIDDISKKRLQSSYRGIQREARRRKGD